MTMLILLLAIASRNCVITVRDYRHTLTRRGLLYELPEPNFGRPRLGQEPHINKKHFIALFDGLLILFLCTDGLMIV